MSYTLLQGYINYSMIKEYIKENNLDQDLTMGIDENFRCFSTLQLLEHI